MLGSKTVLARLAAPVLFFVLSQGIAQSDGLPVTLVLRDGTQAPFTISPGNRNTGNQLMAFFTGDLYAPWGQFVANVGGGASRIPITQLLRADLVSVGNQLVWRATLNDGRAFDGVIVEAASAHFFLQGVNQFGAEETLISYVGQPDPRRQPFIGVIVNPDASSVEVGPDAAARAGFDAVSLRNGDVLSGTILTAEFTVQASYGTLTFTSEQLASIAIEDAAGRTDQFVLKVGDRVSGVLQNTSIQMTLSSGATITLEKGNIASITFARQ